MTVKTTRILVMEDDEPTQRYLRLALLPEGYDVILAKTQDQALTTVRQGEIDLMIMDYRVNGVEPSVFLDQVRSLGFTGGVLLCTAMRGEFELKVDDILFKPFDPNELVERVSLLLRSDR